MTESEKRSSGSSALEAHETPRSLARRLAHRPHLAWLDGDGSRRGRYSFVASDPVAIVRAAFDDRDPLAVLAALDASPTDDAHPDVPRWIGYVAYDAAWSGEGGARHPRDDAPVVWFARYDAVAVFDAARDEAYVVGDDPAACARFLARLGEATEPRATIGELVADDAATHAASIAQALEAIRGGDYYQVNLARRFEAGFTGSPIAIAEAMHDASPVPYGLYLDDGARVVVGRSMERFLRFDRATRRIETRPIKGTIAASVDRARDASSLRTDPKEHAEHAMVVDLLRNDLGRVAKTGTVRVEEAFVVEPFAGLSHLVSTIACEARDEVDVESLLRATFPPGSVTGTPKRAVVRAIEALERHARGVYCGAYGTVTRGGDLDLAVAIRTATLAGSRLVYWAGGGIVEASDPEREVLETELKCRVLRDAGATLRGRAGAREPVS